MTIPTLIMLSLGSATLCVSMYALFAARRTSDRALSKRVFEHSTRLNELEEDLDQLAAALKRERVRQNMAKLREDRKATAPDVPEASGNGLDRRPGESDSEYNDRWQREMNYRIATGQVRVGAIR